MSIKIRCKRDNGDKGGGSISAPLCISKKLAKIRGKRYLDDPNEGNYFDTVLRNYVVPHKKMLKPGDFICIESNRVKGGIFKVLSYELNITKSEILGTIEAIRYGA
jgi:hypothetical protein